MADGVLGLGTGAGTLNNELIEKLKTAERASTVAPIETSIENIKGEGGESEKLQTIIDKANLLLETIKPFDLFVAGGQTAFDNKTANVTGSSAIFDAVDGSVINEGTTTVHINKLAQKDVFQTNVFSDATAKIPTTGALGENFITLSQAERPVYQSNIKVSADDIVDASGTGKITIDGKDFNVSSTMTYSQLMSSINNDENLNAKITLSGRLSITSSDEKTEITIVEDLASNTGLSRGEKYSSDNISYDDLAKNINTNSNYIASVEAVGTGENRIIIKSLESGLDNKIDITQTGIDLGLNEVANNTVKAQNLEATVDGIDYNVSSNILIVEGGLKITAVEVDEVGKSSSISINKDTTTIEPALKNFITMYNDLVSLVDEELYSGDSNIKDKGTLRSMMNNIKDTLFGSYGSEDNLNIFNVGFEISKTGVLSLDSTKFNEAIENDVDSIKSLFIGVAEDRGLGTKLKEIVDNLDGFEGLLSTYQSNIETRKEALEKEKDKAIETLDSKYAALSLQFASYNTIINQFETQFSGLKLMIGQSTARN